MSKIISLISNKGVKNQYGLYNTPYGKPLSQENAAAIAANVVPTAAERIAEGPLYNPMNLPEAEVKKMNALGVNGVGATNIITSGDDDDDDGETNGFYYDDHNIFSFTGEKNKGKKPNADLTKLPTRKAKPKKANVKVLSDKDGNDYEYLGQWNGDLSFLDEVAKNIAPPPAGSFLYRKPSGARLKDLIQMEYYIGLNPDTTDLFIGKKGATMFKPIGHKFVAASEYSNFTFGTAGINGINSLNSLGQKFALSPNIGTSSLYNVRAGNTNFGNLTLNNGNVKPVGFGSFYTPLAGNSLNYTADKNPKKDEETSNGNPGSGFEKVANGIANIATAGAAVINAIKSNKQTIPVGASNGDLGAYVASQNAGGGFGPGSLGGFGGGGYDEDGNYVVSGNGTGAAAGSYPTVQAAKSNTLLYVTGAIAITGLIFYYIKNKK